MENLNLLRFQSSRFCRYIVDRVTSKLNEGELKRNAIVFSPHPDDETLGCGGTIIKKKRAGAEVKIVFMADGRTANSQLISENELKSIRAKEGLEASRMLGLKDSDVEFLEYKDYELESEIDSAVHKVVDLLQHQRPDEVFIPHEREKINPDHVNTNRAVMRALKIFKGKVIVYEYPIWLWHSWPWISPSTATPSEIYNALKQSFVSGWALLRDFRDAVYIGDVLELKRATLAMYKSQMTRLINDPRWITLGDVSNGEFLKCFFQEYEFFHVHCSTHT